MADRDLLIGIDAGTSWIKAVAFDLCGKQVQSSAIKNTYRLFKDGRAVQSMPATWADCVGALQGLAAKIPTLADRVAAVGVTAQGDGSWLIDGKNQPVGDAWLWLDARSAPLVEELRSRQSDQQRYEITGTGLTCCQMGSQIAHRHIENSPELTSADLAFHCKDWLYLKLTGIRASDPSEAVSTFGDFRTRTYSDEVLAALDLSDHKALLPDIIDGADIWHPLSHQAATETGLRAGTPVVLGYIDIVCSALGAGVYTDGASAGCSILGSTGIHSKASSAETVALNTNRTGYVLALPIPGQVLQLQSNMAAALNIDWLLAVAGEILAEFGAKPDDATLLSRIDFWLRNGTAGEILFHPYISEAGERGPFIDASARANFAGIGSRHGFSDLVRAVVEGLAMASRDCFSAMGEIPSEIRISGGAARSEAVRQIMAAALNKPVRYSDRAEAGAAGAAMIAAKSVGVFSSMADCIDDWVVAYLKEVEMPDPILADLYERVFAAYVRSRTTLPSVWSGLQAIKNQRPA